MTRFLFFLFINFASSIVIGQNLVPNPSFEEYDSCPGGLGDFSVEGWWRPLNAWGSPDYYNTCALGQTSVPYNILGHQLPKEGSAYVGIHMNIFDGNNTREYIQTKLLFPLIEGETYELSFFISLADSCNLACNNMGAYFSESAVPGFEGEYINVQPQIVFNPDIIIENDTIWTELKGSFIASGGEQYLTVGVFSDDLNTAWVQVRDSGYLKVPYYYLDSFSLRNITKCSKVNSNILYPNVLTPNGDGKNDLWYPIGNLEELEAVYVLNRWGNIVVELNEETSFSWDGRSNNEIISSGVYYIVEEKENCALKNVGTIHLVK